MVIMGSSVPGRVSRCRPAWRKYVISTIRLVSTIVFIGLSETNTIGYVWSKNPNTALWKELRIDPRSISGLHMEHLILHTQRQLRVGQVEDARRMDWKTL